MAAWTEELKQKVITLYTDGEPSPESSVELIKDIADEVGQTANGVRQVLIQADVYVKKAAPAGKAGKATTEKEGTKRPSKESQIDGLRKAIEARNAEVDEDIISKLTGKAATYFTSVLNA